MRPTRLLPVLYTAACFALASCDGVSFNGTQYESVDTPTAGIFLDTGTRSVLPEGITLRAIFQPGIDLTKTSEGWRQDLYHDGAGYCTIGYGHLVKLGPCNGDEPEDFRRGLSEAAGEALLRDDLAIAETAVLTLVEGVLTDGQYAALCDFVFNVGQGNFRRSTLLKVLNNGAYADVPEQLRRWVKAGGRELPGLVTRREREIELFYHGQAIPRSVPSEDELVPEAIDIMLGEA